MPAWRGTTLHAAVGVDAAGPAWIGTADQVRQVATRWPRLGCAAWQQLLWCGHLVWLKAVAEKAKDTDTTTETASEE